jgi:hypothetical protein
MQRKAAHPILTWAEFIKSMTGDAHVSIQTNTNDRKVPDQLRPMGRHRDVGEVLPLDAVQALRQEKSKATREIRG